MRLQVLCAGVKRHAAQLGGSLCPASSFQTWPIGIPARVCLACKLETRVYHTHLPNPARPYVAGPFAAVCRSQCKTAAALGGPHERQGSSKAPLPDDELADLLLTGGRITHIAHSLWKQVLRPGDTAVDATLGNGNDALELARTVLSGDEGRVVGLDLQEAALIFSRSLLEYHLTSQQMERVQLVQGCHSRLLDHVEPASVRLVCFNLGYLPGGDHSFVTSEKTTVAALEAAAQAVAPGGLISVVAYIGQAGGREEYGAVQHFAASLPPEAWACSHLDWINRPSGPKLFILKRKECSSL